MAHKIRGSLQSGTSEFKTRRKAIELELVDLQVLQSEDDAHKREMYTKS